MPTFKVHYELYLAGGRVVPTWSLIFDATSEEQALARVRRKPSARLSGARVERITKHTCRAARVGRRDGLAPSYRAVCSCGWGGSFTQVRAKAQHQRDEHKANNTGS